MADKETKDEGTKKSEKFLKEAYCIDGECKYIGLNVIKNLVGASATFELTDSKRGTFYITITQKA